MKATHNLYVTFHNPNTNEETAKFFAKIMANIAVENYLVINKKSDRYFNSTDNTLIFNTNMR